MPQVDGRMLVELHRRQARALDLVGHRIVLAAPANEALVPAADLAKGIGAHEEQPAAKNHELTLRLAIRSGSFRSRWLEPVVATANYGGFLEGQVDQPAVGF